MPLQSAHEEEMRSTLRRTFGNNTQTLNEGYASTLAGMLAARKRDWREATRAYLAALTAFTEVANHLEHAKTAVKYGTMVLAKAAETDRPDREELESAIETVGRALLVLKSRNMAAEVEDGERVLLALQRMGIRTR